MDDLAYMRRCLALAEASREAGETPVGSLIVRGGQVLGEGIEGVRSLLDPSAHAEVQALRAACHHEAPTNLKVGAGLASIPFG